jgi:glycerol-3-phosphate acyltransferase PlsY
LWVRVPPPALKKNMAALTLSVLILAYLQGSFPTAYIAGRIICGKDIRQMGDGNMGAQNAFRLFGSRIGIAVGLVDFLKGATAVSLARLANMSVPVILLSGMLVVAGHN